jgi:hypothetical protein
LGWFRGQEFGPIENMVRDELLERFRHYAKQMTLFDRIRKRSGAKIARVAAARKLAEICWKRLRRWQREHASQAA